MISKIKDVMNIDIESIGLLSLILQESPKDRLLILCVLARSNSAPTRITFKPITDYPTFYGYSNSRIPFYLMGKGVLNNVPREGYTKRLISSYDLAYAETVINGAKNWDIHQKLMSVSKFLTLDNKTTYKDAEVFLVYRNKASDYIKGYATSHREELSSFLGLELDKELSRTKAFVKSTAEFVQANWSNDFKWEGKDFVFGKYGSINFISDDRKHILKILTDKKGGWATISELKGNKDAGYVRSTIKQIEDRLPEKSKGHIKIVSTQDDDGIEKPNTGAYRIKVQP